MRNRPASQHDYQTSLELTKIRILRRRTNWGDELWKLATAIIALRLVLAEKSELNLSQRYFQQAT